MLSSTLLSPSGFADPVAITFRSSTLTIFTSFPRSNSLNLSEEEPLLKKKKPERYTSKLSFYRPLVRTTFSFFSLTHSSRVDAAKPSPLSSSFDGNLRARIVKGSKVLNLGFPSDRKDDVTTSRLYGRLISPFFFIHFARTVHSPPH